MTFPCRNWLIAALTHKPLPPFPEAMEAIGCLVQCASEEGVTLLLEQALAGHPEFKSIAPDLRQAIEQAARIELLGQLSMLREQQQVFAALLDAGTPFLVMKGGALAHWLYPMPHLRLVTDLDLLLPDRDAAMALEPVLANAGYSMRPMTDDRLAKEHPFHKPGGPYGTFVVDVHWRLFNSQMFQLGFDYDVLKHESMPLPNLPGVYGLGSVHALINACGHRALNLPYTYVHGVQRANCLRWLWDIHLLAGRLDDAQWRTLKHRARDSRVSAILQEALRKVQDELGTVLPAGLLADLDTQARSEEMDMSWFSSWPRYQWGQFLVSDPNWVGRFRWVVQRLWPKPEAVRERYGAGDPAWKFMLRRIGVGFLRLFGRT